MTGKLLVLKMADEKSTKLSFSCNNIADKLGTHHTSSHTKVTSETSAIYQNFHFFSLGHL